MRYTSSWKTGVTKFRRSDLKDLKNTIRTVRNVGDTHFGLGMGTAFILAVVLGSGALLQVAEKGAGKTTIITAIKNWVRKNKGDLVWDKEQTMAGADKKFNDFFSNKEFVLWSCDDLAKLSPAVQHGMLKVVAAVIQDHNCKVKTSMYDCHIENCNLSFIGASVFEIYDKLWELPEWRGSYSDRFLRFYAFTYGRKGINRNTPIISKFRNCPTAEVENDKTFRKFADMLESQFTMERSIEYAERMLTGNARLNGRDIVTSADYKFMNLFRINIEAEIITGERDTFVSPLEIDTNALFLLSECLKRGNLHIPTLIKKRKVIDNDDLAFEIARDYPQFFTRKGNTLYPNKKFIDTNLKPQQIFEQKCVDLNG